VLFTQTIVNLPHDLLDIERSSQALFQLVDPRINILDKAFAAFQQLDCRVECLTAILK